jgi:hypothetical protein
MGDFVNASGDEGGIQLLFNGSPTSYLRAQGYTYFNGGSLSIYPNNIGTLPAINNGNSLDGRATVDINGTNTGGSRLAFLPTSSSNSRYWRVGADDFSASGSMDFVVGDDSANPSSNRGQVVMTLTKERRIGINVTAPNAMLEVNGNISVNRIISNNDAVNKSYAGTHGAATNVISGQPITHNLGVMPTGCLVTNNNASQTSSVITITSTAFTVSNNKSSTLVAGAASTIYWECWV